MIFLFHGSKICVAHVKNRHNIQLTQETVTGHSFAPSKVSQHTILNGRLRGRGDLAMSRKRFEPDIDFKSKSP